MLKRTILFLALLCLNPSPSLANQKIILNTSNTVNFRGPVTSASVLKAQLDLTAAVIKRGSDKYPIYLVFDSPGGSIGDGLDLLAFAKTLSNVHTISMYSASMAAFLVEALPGKRYITDDGYLMFHRAKGSFQGQFEVGEVESMLQLAKKLVLKLEKKVAARLGIPLAVYKNYAKDEWWLDADDAIKYKAADAIVDIYCTPSLIKSEDSQVAESMFGSFSIKYSGCPLFRSPTN